MGNLVRQHLEDQRSAIALFKTIVNKGVGYREALQLIAEQPAAALAAIQNIQTELTPQGAAKILEEVVNNEPDAAAAAALVNNHLSKARQIELLTARSDLESTAAEVVDIDVVLQAIRTDLGDDTKIEDDEPAPKADGQEADDGANADDEDASDKDSETDRTSLLRAAYVTRSWARKLRDRDDYQRILDASIVEGYTFRECLLIGLANETLRDNRLRDEEVADVPDMPMDQSMFGSLSDEERLIPDEALEALGLDPNEALDQLRELLENKRLMRFRQQEIATVQAEREEKRLQQATVEAARDTAAQAADKVDF